MLSQHHKPIARHNGRAMFQIALGCRGLVAPVVVGCGHSSEFPGTSGILASIVLWWLLFQTVSRGPDCERSSYPSQPKGMMMPDSPTSLADVVLGSPSHE